jgi:hypothetical protein
MFFTTQSGMNDPRLGPSWSPCGNQAHPSRTKLENLLASKPQIQCSMQKTPGPGVPNLEAQNPGLSTTSLNISKLPKIATAFGPLGPSWKETIINTRDNRFTHVEDAPNVSITSASMGANPIHIA